MTTIKYCLGSGRIDQIQDVHFTGMTSLMASHFNFVPLVLVLATGASASVAIFPQPRTQTIRGDRHRVASDRPVDDGISEERLTLAAVPTRLQTFGARSGGAHFRASAAITVGTQSNYIF